MFSKGIIKKRVMEAVNSKITALQEQLDTGVREIDQKAEAEKEHLADRLVASITDKLL